MKLRLVEKFRSDGTPYYEVQRKTFVFWDNPLTKPFWTGYEWDVKYRVFKDRESAETAMENYIKHNMKPRVLKEIVVDNRTMPK